MDKINQFLSNNAKYVKLSKPLTAAKVCDTAREVSDGRFKVISFKDGLLTLGVENSSAAANLQMESDQIIDIVNQKLTRNLVRKIRIKLI